MEGKESCCKWSLFNQCTKYRHGRNNINEQYCAVFHVKYRTGKISTLGFHSVWLKKQRHSQVSILTKKKKKKKKNKEKKKTNQRTQT